MLKYDLTMVDNWRDLDDEVTTAVIKEMMCIGLRDLTVYNLDDAVERSRILGESRVMTMDGQTLFTKETLTKYIGLITNVSNESFTNWSARMKEVYA